MLTQGLFQEDGAMPLVGRWIDVDEDRRKISVPGIGALGRGSRDFFSGGLYCLVTLLRAFAIVV